MIRRTVLILSLTLMTSAWPPNDIDDPDFGQSIAASVQAELAPLQNLGARINAAVQRELKPLRSMNLHNNYGSGRQLFSPGFGDFGSQIASSVQAGLAPLNNLGSQIAQQVEQGLQPVKAMGLIASMKGGMGGITIATHSPSGKQIIFKDGNAFVCSGPITASGRCEGTSEPYTVKTNSDYCFLRNSYSIINDYICIGATSVQVINNNIRCENSNNLPVLVMKKDEFNNMCKDLSQSVEYRYIADLNNPAHVQIPNENKYVRCTNNEPNVCVFSESSSLNGGTNIVSTSGQSFSSNVVLTNY